MIQNEIVENGQTYIVEIHDNGTEVKFIKPSDTMPVNKTISKYGFMTRFTMEELAGIYTLAKTNTMVEVFVDLLKVADNIDLNDTNVTNGLDYLVSLSAITDERKTVILS